MGCSNSSRINNVWYENPDVIKFFQKKKEISEKNYHLVSTGRQTDTQTQSKTQQSEEIFVSVNAI